MNATAVVVIVLIVLALIIIGPLFSIWSLNALFGTAIAVNFGNWLAMAWLHMALAGVAFHKKGK